MRGLIALSGALSVDIRRDDVPETADIIWLRNYCEKADLVIAADGGLNLSSYMASFLYWRSRFNGF